MVVPRGTAARREEENALLELEAALSACLHPPPSSGEPPTMKKPSVAIPRDTLTGALLVFPRQPPMLVATEPPRPFATTMLMANAPALVSTTPAPMAAPWLPTPLPFATTVPVERPAPTLVPRPRSRGKWLALLVVLLAVTGVLAVRPQLRARAKTTAHVIGKRVVQAALVVKAHARRALHR